MPKRELNMVRWLGGHKTLPNAVKAYERYWLRRALKNEENLKEAADLLRISHQTLSLILRSRHKGLRKPIRAERSDKGKQRKGQTRGNKGFLRASSEPK